MRLSLEQVDKLINRVAVETKRINQQYDIQLAYVFGSYAKQKATAKSDIDIAVWINPHSPFVLNNEISQLKMELIDKYTLALKRNDIDLVILNQSNPTLSFQIVKHGKLVYQATPLIKVLFENKVWKEYADTEKLRKMLEQQVDRRMKKLKNIQ